MTYISETCEHLAKGLGYDSITKFQLKPCQYGDVVDDGVNALEECGMPKEGERASFHLVEGVKNGQTVTQTVLGGTEMTT